MTLIIFLIVTNNYVSIIGADLPCFLIFTTIPTMRLFYIGKNNKYLGDSFYPQG